MLATCRDVKLEYKVLREKVKEINKKDAKFYGNMFAKLNKLEPFDTEVSFTGSFTFFVWKLVSTEVLTDGFLILLCAESSSPRGRIDECGQQGIRGL